MALEHHTHRVQNMIEKAIIAAATVQEGTIMTMIEIDVEVIMRKVKAKVRNTRMPQRPRNLHRLSREKTVHPHKTRIPTKRVVKEGIQSKERIMVVLMIKKSKANKMKKASCIAIRVTIVEVRGMIVMIKTGIARTIKIK